MVTEAENLLWGPQKRLRDLLAACAAWQTFTDTATAEAAAAKIHHFSMTANTAATIAARPYALIDQADSFRVRTRSPGYRAESGSLFLMFEANVPAEHKGDTLDDIYDAAAWFCQAVGDILAELIEASWAAGGMRISEVVLMAGPLRADKTTAATEGDFYQVCWEIRWGEA